MGTKSPQTNMPASTSIRASPEEMLSALDLATHGGLASFDALALSYADFLGFPSCDGFSEMCLLLGASNPPVICAPRQGSGYLSSKKALDPAELRNELRRNGVVMEGRDSLSVFFGPTPAMMNLDTMYLAQSVHAILEDAKSKSPRLFLTLTTLVEVDGDAVRAVQRQIDKGGDDGCQPPLMQTFMDNGGHLVPCFRRSKPGVAWPKPIRVSILNGVPMGEFRWGNKGGGKGGRFDKAVTGYFALVYYDLTSISGCENNDLFETELTCIADEVVKIAAASVRDAMNTDDEWMHRRPERIGDEGGLDLFNAYVIAPEDYASRTKEAMGELVGALATGEPAVYCISSPANALAKEKAALSTVKSPSSRVGGALKGVPEGQPQGAKNGEGLADLACYMGDAAEEKLRPDESAGPVTFVKMELQMARVHHFRVLQTSKLQNTFAEHANRGVCFGSDRYHLTINNDGATYCTRLEIILHNSGEVVSPLMAARTELAIRRALSTHAGGKLVVEAAMPTQTKYASGFVLWIRFPDHRLMNGVFNEIFVNDNRLKLALAPVYSHASHGTTCYALHPHLAVVTITSSRLNSNIQLAPEGLFAQWLRRLANLHIGNQTNEGTGVATNLSTYDAAKAVVEWSSICVVRDIKGVGKSPPSNKAQIAVRILCPNTEGFLRQIGRQIQSNDYLLSTALPDSKAGWSHYVDVEATTRCVDGLKKIFEVVNTPASVISGTNQGSAIKCENMFAELSDIVARDEVEKEKKSLKLKQKAAKTVDTCSDDVGAGDDVPEKKVEGGSLKVPGIIDDVTENPGDLYLQKKYTLRACTSFRLEIQNIQIGERARELAGQVAEEELKYSNQEKRISEADLRAGRTRDYLAKELLDSVDSAIVNVPARHSLSILVQQLISGGVYDLTDDAVTSTQRQLASSYIDYIFDAFANVGEAEKNSQLCKVLGHSAAWPIDKNGWTLLTREGSFDKATIAHEALAGLQWARRSEGKAVFHFAVIDIIEESVSFLLNPHYSLNGLVVSEHRPTTSGGHELSVFGPVCLVVKDGFAYRLAVRKADHLPFAAQYILTRLGAKRPTFLTRAADDEKFNKAEVLKRSKEGKASWRIMPTPLRERGQLLERVVPLDEDYDCVAKRIDFSAMTAPDDGNSWGGFDDNEHPRPIPEGLDKGDMTESQ